MTDVFNMSTSSWLHLELLKGMEKIFDIKPVTDAEKIIFNLLFKLLPLFVGLNLQN